MADIEDIVIYNEKNSPPSIAIIFHKEEKDIVREKIDKENIKPELKGRIIRTLDSPSNKFNEKTANMVKVYDGLTKFLKRKKISYEILNIAERYIIIEYFRGNRVKF